MKKIIVLFLLMVSWAQAQTDSTWLDLEYKEITPKAKQIIVTIIATNPQEVDLAGYQSVIMFPTWLQLTNFMALQSDGTQDNGKSGSFGPRNVKVDTVKQNVLYFANNMTEPAVRDQTPIAQLTFKIDSLHQLIDQEKIWLIIDNIKLSNWAVAVKSNKRIALTMVVGADTAGTDTTDHDTTDVRYKATMSLSPGGDHSGYQLDSGQAIIKVDLGHKAIINQLDFTLTLPDTNWRLERIIPINRAGSVDYEKLVAFNRLTNGQYTILISGDKAEHPWLPDINQPKRSIMKMIMSRPVASFGSQTFTITGMSAYSQYESEDITVNQYSEVSINLNPFFGQVIGRKGDLQFNNWNFGDGRFDSLDLIIEMDIYTKAIIPNDYQLWAADINGDNKIDAQDIAALQALIATSEVKNYTLKSWQIDYYNNYLYLQRYNDTPLTVIIYDLGGKIILSKKYINSDILLLNLPTGCYLTTYQTASELMFKKIIVH